MSTPEEITKQLIQVEKKLKALSESPSNDKTTSEQIKKNQEEKNRYSQELESGYLEIAYMSKIDFSQYAGVPLDKQFKEYRDRGESLYAKIKMQLINGDYKSVELKTNKKMVV